MSIQKAQSGGRRRKSRGSRKSKRQSRSRRRSRGGKDVLSGGSAPLTLQDGGRRKRRSRKSK